MVISKKGGSLPINLIIIVVIGLFVFGAAYFGFIKPSQEGSSIFGDQIDAFKDRKFSLMDLDTLTHKEKQDACDSNPQAIVDNTVNTIKSYIPDNCVLAKSVAERLREGKVDGCDTNFTIVPADEQMIDELINKVDGCIELIVKRRNKKIKEEQEISESISTDVNYGKSYTKILENYVHIVTVYNLGFEEHCGGVMDDLIEASKENAEKLLSMSRSNKSLSPQQYDAVNNILAQSRYFEFYCETLKKNCNAENDVYSASYGSTPSSKYSFENHPGSELPNELLGEKIKTAYHVIKAECLNDNLKYGLAWKEYIHASQTDRASQLVESKKNEYLNILFEKIFQYLGVDEMEEVYDGGDGKGKILDKNLVGCPEDGIEASEEMDQCHSFNDGVLMKFIGPNGINEASNLKDALDKEIIPQEYKPKFLCYFDSNLEDECDSCVGINSCDDYPTGGSEWGEVCAADPCDVGTNGCWANAGLFWDYCDAH